MKINYSNVLNPDSNSNVTVSIDETEICPMCKHAIRPVKLFCKIFCDASNMQKLSMTYYCSHCYNIFIAQYSNKNYNSVEKYYSFDKLDFVAPNKFEIIYFEDCIKEISPMFVKIYNQAAEAEHFNLDEIAGIGYRKALEFLIKDFLIHKNPQNEDSIKATLLGTCINNFIDNPQLKNVASRAVWLGNDQTHYTQKFEDKDINDLKRLIKLTVSWITMLYLTEEAINDIEKP